ncbi:MAG: tyrosine--tRNA ligase [Puniceicoccales bacterium]|jgi:tyrosyl-tRNA synthetase|nr:tyrosine--tRNA ligase [Puniceicoccales bacterium]
MARDPLDILCDNVQHLVGREDLARKLASGRKLRIKLGVDPTRPDLTYGHMVVLSKLRQFQDMGHEALFLIGDFTTTIGDPSGRSEARPVLTEEQIRINSKTYLEQTFKILDPKKTTVRRNGEWFSAMSLGDMLLLAREMTVAQLLERDDFSKRYHGGTPIALVEFLYPLLQGHDSVVLEADVELGGSDQLFNMLVGRAMQKSHAMEEQAVLCMPLLVGLDGVRKMSKSFDNYIAFNDSAREMFGKIMSLPDGTMETYYRLLLGRGDDEIGQLKSLHPMEAKKLLAAELVARFHGEVAAGAEREYFEKVFSSRETPEEMEEIDLRRLPAGAASIVDVLALDGEFSSKNEIRRLIEQGAVRLNGERVGLADELPQNLSGSVLQVGRRRFFRLR